MDTNKQLERNISTSSLNSKSSNNINFDKISLNEEKNQTVENITTLSLEKKKIVQNNDTTKLSPKVKKKNKKKCFTCKKKLGLLNFECKCKNMFCSMHLNPESHNCNYNFKEEQKKRLEKQLIKVVNDKVIRI